MPAGSGPSAGLRPGEVRSAVTEAPASQCALPLPGESVDAPRVRRAPPARPRPPGGVGRRRPRRRRRRRPSPAPRGGVELVMSPRLALCEAGWRESSRGGFRRAGLARCEAGWTVSRWARITQARPGPGPVIPLSGPGITQVRPGPDPVQELVSAEDEHPGPGPPRPDLRRLGAGRADPGVGEAGGADAGRARAGPGPVRVSCTPSRA